MEIHAPLCSFQMRNLDYCARALVTMHWLHLSIRISLFSWSWLFTTCMWWKTSVNLEFSLMGQPSNSSTQGILELGTGSFYMYKKKIIVWVDSPSWRSTGWFRLGWFKSWVLVFWVLTIIEVYCALISLKCLYIYE